MLTGFKHLQGAMIAENLCNDRTKDFISLLIDISIYALELSGNHLWKVSYSEKCLLTMDGEVKYDVWDVPLTLLT